MLLFDDKFPIKKFVVKTLGLNDSDWVLAQPKKNLSDIKKENTFVMLPNNKEINVATVPIEVVRLFKIWKMDGLSSQTVKREDGFYVPHSPIMREKFEEVFGTDVDWVNSKIKGFQKLASAYLLPKTKASMEETIKLNYLEIPMWAIEK